MALDLQPPPTRPPARRLADERPPGIIADRAFRWLTLLAGMLVLVVLGLILYSTTQQAWPVFQAEGLDFIFKNDWNPAAQSFGAASFVYGTLAISVIALLLAVPISLGIALFVTEVAPRRLRRPVVYALDLLATIPSVVFGLWGLYVFAPAVLGLYQNLADMFHGVPIVGALLNGTPVSARSFMTAGVILAIMVVPIITSISREVFATTPVAQKEAALALGATRWEMIRGAVLPHGRSGVTSAVLIGLGRAIGETIAVVLLIGSLPNQITAQLFNPGDSMSSVIINQFGEAVGTQRAALIGLGVLLFVITLIVGVIARAIIAGSDRRLGIPSR